jgi:hypothetical protein
MTSSGIRFQAREGKSWLLAPPSQMMGAFRAEFLWAVPSGYSDLNFPMYQPDHSNSTGICIAE